jgi:3-oxoadipate enol-lactonase
MNLDLAGTRVAFEMEGHGPTVVFLHAFPLSSAMWAATAGALAGRFRVVRLDVRGFGGSEIGGAPLTMARIAEDAAAVLDHLGAERAAVVGCSMGGYAALAFAQRFAARLCGLALVDTKASADTDEGRAGRAALAQKVMAQGAVAAADAMLPKLVGATTHRERPDVVEAVRRGILAAAPGAIANALQAMGARPDSRPTLGAIGVPTLVLRGEEDAIISAEDAQTLHEGISDSRLVTLPRLGHLPSLEGPAAFEAALSSFLAPLPC